MKNKNLIPYNVNEFTYNKYKIPYRVNAFICYKYNGRFLGLAAVLIVIYVNTFEDHKTKNIYNKNIKA